MAARFAAAIGRRLALVGKALGKHPREPVGRIIGVVGVIAVALAGEQNMQHVMAVIVPLCVEIAGEGLALEA